MSTHECPVVKVELHKHPNADTLSIATVFKFPVVVKTEEFKDEKLAVYIPPDSLVPVADPLFSWLPHKGGATHVRVKARRFRGVPSQGILIPLSKCNFGLAYQPGDNLIERLGVEHYEPPIPTNTGGEDETNGPSGIYPRYDVENFNRYGEVFQPGEMVIVTEKIHGANARFLYLDDKMWCGSRTRWKKDTPSCLWWRALRACPAIREWCWDHPGLTLYVEVFGQVQDLKYGAGTNDVFVAIFDVLDLDGTWMSWNHAHLVAPWGPWVPLLWYGPFDETKVRELAEGESQWAGANHMAEGVVVKPEVEQFDARVGRSGGRKQLKIVSNRYLERK